MATKSSIILTLLKSVTDTAVIQAELDRQATHVNNLKIEIYALKKQINEATAREAAKQYTPPSDNLYANIMRPATASELTTKRQALIGQMEIERDALKEIEKDKHQYGAIDFTQQIPAQAVPDNAAKQKEANRLAMAIVQKKNDIALFNKIIKGQKEKHDNAEKTRIAKLRQEQETLSKNKSEEDDNSNISSSSSSSSISATPFVIPVNLQQFEAKLQQELTDLESELSKKEKEGYYGFAAENERIVATDTLVGGGCSLGREGPSVQLAGALASNLAGLAGEPKQNRRFPLCRSRRRPRGRVQHPDGRHRLRP